MIKPVRLAIALSILAVAGRLILIDQAFIDNWSWRQSDVAAIARNYFQGGFHFARPQIDWAGDQPGYVGTEFPILPFLAAICYKICGVHEWVGRIQAVLLFAVSLPFFFLLVRRISGETAAVWALFFYGFAPLGIMASRCFMPDVPSLALSIIGLYFFTNWLENERSRSFLASAVCISSSILIKATSAIVLAPILYLAVAAVYSSRRSATEADDRRKQEEFGARRASLQFSLFAAIALIPSATWYWHAHEIALKFYPYHFFGAGGVRIMPASWYLKIAKLLVTSTLTPPLFLIAALGAVMTVSPVRLRTFHCWLGAMILFVVIVGYGNRHQWYQLPFVPIAALFAGNACSVVAAKISTRGVKICLSTALALVFGFLTAIYAPGFYRPAGSALREAGLELKRTTPPNAVIVGADNGDPTVLYYAERKGWHFLEKNGIYDGEPKNSAQAIVDLEQLRKKGARYLVFTSDTSWWLDYYLDFTQHLNSISALKTKTPAFVIYELKPPE